MAELSNEAAALVEAGRAALRPAAGDRARILAALHDKLPLAAQLAPAPASSVGWPVIASVVAGVALVGGVAFVSLSSSDPMPSAPIPAVAPPAPIATEASATEVAPAPEAPAVAPEAPAEDASKSQRRPADRLAEEVSILSRAETELHAGRYSSALRVLEEHQRKFPRGTLTQERIAARVRALCALGRVSEAQGDLARLAPGSLHASRAREACAAKSSK
jgi:hypothetical protein